MGIGVISEVGFQSVDVDNNCSSGVLTKRDTNYSSTDLLGDPIRFFPRALEFGSGANRNGRLVEPDQIIDGKQFVGCSSVVHSFLSLVLLAGESPDEGTSRRERRFKLADVLGVRHAGHRKRKHSSGR